MRQFHHEECDTRASRREVSKESFAEKTSVCIAGTYHLDRPLIQSRGSPCHRADIPPQRTWRREATDRSRTSLGAVPRTADPSDVRIGCRELSAPHRPIQEPQPSRTTPDDEATSFVAQRPYSEATYGLRQETLLGTEPRALGRQSEFAQHRPHRSWGSPPPWAAGFRTFRGLSPL